MSDTPRTDAALAFLKRKNEQAAKESSPGDMAGYSVTGVQRLINDAKKMERELAVYTALRAHTERLAEALEETLDLIDRCSIDETPRDFHETKQESYQALTLYRAENPKV